MRVNKTFRGAVLLAPAQKVQICRLHIDEIGPDEVLVRNCASGLCHTDLEVVDGTLEAALPAVLGHESAGIVEALGENVTELSVGDLVVASWGPSCGNCFYCERDQPILCELAAQHYSEGNLLNGARRLRLGDDEVGHFMFISGHAEYSVLHRSTAVKIRDDVSPVAACLIGCGVMTGAGAIFNIAKVGVSESVMVIGCGGVGMSAINAAAISAASLIVAVDLNDAKLELAKTCGATASINPAQVDVAAEVWRMTQGRGVDHVIEAAGVQHTLQTALDCVRPGGNLVILGKTANSKHIPLRWESLMGEKNIRRSSYGGARPHRDFPLLADLYADNRLKLDELITEQISLDEINDAYERMRRGEVLRSVIVFPEAQQ